VSLYNTASTELAAALTNLNSKAQYSKFIYVTNSALFSYCLKQPGVKLNTHLYLVPRLRIMEL
jgi:hypothetical protein